MEQNWVGFQVFSIEFEFLLDLVLKTMQEGTIAKIMDKGYGFISREGESKDLFFHSNELQNVSFDDLREGDKVSFEVNQGMKGPQAVTVSRV